MHINVIKTFEGLEAVRSPWERWQRHPNSDFAQFAMICTLRPEVESPYVAVVGQNGRPQALLAGRLERTRIAPAIGYAQLAGVPAKVLTVLHQGLLGRDDEEVGELLVRHLWSALAAGEADAVAFHKLSEESPLLRAVQAHGPRRWREKNPVWMAHWQTALESEPGFLLKSMKPKHRALIRKRERDLEAAFPGKVSWRWVSRFDDVAAFCAQVEEVAARTYQRGLGSGFRNDEEHRRRYALYADRGQLRAQVLEIEGKIHAFDIGIIYHDTFFGAETGYDQRLREFSPGTLVMLRMIDELVREGIRKVDWGLGDAHYKQNLGNRSWRESTVRLFAPSAKGLLLMSMLGASTLLDSAARSMLLRMSLLDKLKTRWRRRLAKA